MQRAAWLPLAPALLLRLSPFALRTTELPAPALDVAAGALIGCAAIVVLAHAFARAGMDRAAWIASIALALDPLAVAAGRAGAATSAAALGCACLCAWMLVPAPTGRERALYGLVAAACLGAALLPSFAPWSIDPSFFAWSESHASTLGAALAVAHHVGEAALPLAVLGALRRPRLLAVLVPAIAFALLAGPGRLESFAGVSAIVAALLGVGLGALPRSAGAVALAFSLAVSAPALLSDLKPGRRFPFAEAAAWLRGHAAGATLYTTAVPSLRGAIGSGAAVEPLPADAAAMDALLRSPGAKALVLPVEGERLFGAFDPALLARLEARRLADFEITLRRFDLYRFEVRVFRLAP